MNNRKILFHLGHPAHFHLLKNVIKSLYKSNTIFILIKEKDVLSKLVEKSGFPYTNILPEGKKKNMLGLLISFLTHSARFLFFCKKHRPDLLVGSSSQVSLIGKLIDTPSINLNEDDVTAIPFYSKITFPSATTIVSPISCDMGQWSNKSIQYNSYHELAYLHKKNFYPKLDIVEKYISTKNPYAVIRLSSLQAYHDKGISGISKDLAVKLVSILREYGNIIISSEELVHPEIEKYRVQIDPLDFHHILAYSYIFIGDSQTVAAEAGVLGIPFLRFNDFVGKLGYLKELEEKYKLGFGIKPSEPSLLINKITDLLKMENREKIFKRRRMKMLKNKIDLASFLTWFIQEYPKTVEIMQCNPNFQDKFIH